MKIRNNKLNSLNRTGLIGLVLLCLCLPIGVHAYGHEDYYFGHDDRNLEEINADAIVTSAVKDLLRTQFQRLSTQLNIDTFRGVVTVRGVVVTSRERRQLIKSIRAVKGVTKVVTTRLMVEN